MPETDETVVVIALPAIKIDGRWAQANPVRMVPGDTFELAAAGHRYKLSFEAL